MSRMLLRQCSRHRKVGMIADSSNISEEKVQKILQDNDLLDATVNATKNAIYAFPFLDVISRLNDRLNELEKGDK